MLTTPLNLNPVIKMIVLSLLIFLPLPSVADPISDLLMIAEQIQGYQQQIAGIQNTIEGLTDQIQAAVSGQSEWGRWQFKNYQSWGKNTDQWEAILQMSGKGDNNSLLGQTLHSLEKEFPVDTHLYNQVNPNKSDRAYYPLKAKTALAVRAASQLGYDKIQEQINYANQLRQQIGTNTTLKQSLDLQNRLTIENNLIQLETLRQLALLNQQQAIDAQAEVNDAIQTARFLIKKF